MTPRQVVPLVKYEGTDISEDLAPHLKSISFTDNMSGYADDLTIRLEDRNGLWESDWFPDRGATLDVSYVTLNWKNLADDLQIMVAGLFAIDTIEGSAPPREIELKATSIPESNELRGVDRTRSWEKAELKTIANDVATGAGLSLVYDSEENPTLDRAEQTEQSDLSFLLKMCEDNGLALKITNEQVVIFSETDYEQVEPKVTIVKPGTPYEVENGMEYVHLITGYRMHAATRDIYKACHVQNSDSDTGETIEATFTDPGKQEGKTLQVKEQVKTVAEAEKLAKKRLREKNRDEWTMTVDMPGDFRMLAATTVNVQGFGKFDGKYIIVSAKHEISGGYTTSVELRRCLDGY